MDCPLFLSTSYSNTITHVQYGSHVFIPNKNVRISLYKEWCFVVQSTENTVIKFLSRNHFYREYETVTEINAGPSSRAV